MLGDLLASLTDETTALETILGAGDLGLLTAVREKAAAGGIEVAAYCEPDGATLGERSLR